MKFLITKTSDWDYMGVRDFSTIEELTHFVEQKGDIVVQKNSRSQFKATPEELASIPYEIEVYDVCSE